MRPFSRSSMRAAMSVLVFIWTTWLPARPALAQSDDRVPVLTVQGSGEVRVTPDVATVRVGIVEQADSAGEAQERVNVVAARILEAVTRLGVNERDVQTARLVLSPVYAPTRPGPGEPPRIVAYRASNSVSIRLEDLDRTGPAIDAALDSGANQLDGVFFGLEDDREARQRALAAAVQDARGKAEAMADALGVDLEGVLSIREGGGFAQPQFETAGVAAALRQDAATPVSPGQLTVSAAVTIDYRISED